MAEVSTHLILHTFDYLPLNTSVLQKKQNQHNTVSIRHNVINNQPLNAMKVVVEHQSKT